MEYRKTEEMTERKEERCMKTEKRKKERKKACSRRRVKIIHNFHITNPDFFYPPVRRSPKKEGRKKRKKERTEEIGKKDNQSLRYEEREEGSKWNTTVGKKSPHRLPLIPVEVDFSGYLFVLQMVSQSAIFVH